MLWNVVSYRRTVVSYRRSVLVVHRVRWGLSLLSQPQRWERMWLHSPKSDAQQRPLVGHWWSWVESCDNAALWRLSLAAWRRCCLSSSNAAVPLQVKDLQVSLSAAKDSRSRGFTHGHLRLLLGVSLYLSFGRPILLLLPSHSSPYSACFGMRWSSILMTWPVQRNWALVSVDLMLCDYALSTTSMFEILSCHRILMIERWYLMWNYSSRLKWRL